jgi:hypothetical protein
LRIGGELRVQDVRVSTVCTRSARQTAWRRHCCCLCSRVGKRTVYISAGDWIKKRRTIDRFWPDRATFVVAANHTTGETLPTLNNH